MTQPESVTRTRIEEIKDCVIKQIHELNQWEMRKARYIAPAEYNYVTEWLPVKKGEVWGKPGETVFFRCRSRVPEQWKGMKVGFEMKTGGEGLLSINGAPIHGIDDNRSYILIAAAASGDEVFDLAVELRVGGYWF